MVFQHLAVTGFVWNRQKSNEKLSLEDVKGIRRLSTFLETELLSERMVGSLVLLLAGWEDGILKPRKQT